MADTTIVIPCYNEEHRLPIAALLEFSTTHADIRFVLVDDGSIDGTSRVLEGLQRTAPGTFTIIQNRQNRGKAEAVRAGMLAAMTASAEFVGYWDADLSTPLDTIIDFRDALLARPALLCVIGSRVQRLGAEIVRKPARHYLGRIFATLASRTLRVAVYDTQCGAKLFRRCSVVETLFNEPFRSRWIFDVEVLARIARLSGSAGASLETVVLEYPLPKWRDVEGSQLGLRAMAGALLDLFGLQRSLR